MTHRLKKRVLEKRQALVISRLSTGHSQADVAREFGATTGAVALFVARHAAEIDEMTAAVNSVVKQNEIANKDFRVKELGAIYNDLKSEREQYGIHVVQTVTETDGETTRVIETRDLRRDLVAESRAVLRAVAEELGQIPKTDQNINIRQQVLIRQIEGVDPEKLG